jgi:hypothetical protein
MHSKIYLDALKLADRRARPCYIDYACCRWTNIPRLTAGDGLSITRRKGHSQEWKRAFLSWKLPYELDEMNFCKPELKNVSNLMRVGIP